jgi:two-component system LytT family response regulator
MDEFLVIKDKKKVHVILFSEIQRLESKGVYTLICMKNNASLLSSKNLKVILAGLCPKTFFRTHHSHVINLNEITRYERGRGGSVILKDGSVVPVSKRRKSGFLKQYLGTAARVSAQQPEPLTGP